MNRSTLWFVCLFLAVGLPREARSQTPDGCPLPAQFNERMREARRIVRATVDRSAVVAHIGGAALDADGHCIQHVAVTTHPTHGRPIDLEVLTLGLGVDRHPAVAARSHSLGARVRDLWCAGCRVEVEPVGDYDGDGNPEVLIDLAPLEYRGRREPAWPIREVVARNYALLSVATSQLLDSGPLWLPDADSRTYHSARPVLRVRNGESMLVRSRIDCVDSEPNTVTGEVASGYDPQRCRAITSSEQIVGDGSAFSSTRWGNAVVHAALTTALLPLPWDGSSVDGSLSPEQRGYRDLATAVETSAPAARIGIVRLLAFRQRTLASSDPQRQWIGEVLHALATPPREDITSLPPEVALHVLTLTRPISRQEVRAARSAADALGLLGDSRAADALVYGLYLNIRMGSTRANAYNNCVRALVRLGPAASVPRLVATINGENVLVNDLLRSYETEPGMPSMPPGFMKAQAIDVLRYFADLSAVDVLAARIRDRAEVSNVRAAAAEALAYTGLSIPRENPRRGAIFDAIAAVFDEAPPSDEHDMAPSVAPALVVLGDARAPELLIRRINDRALQPADMTLARLALLMPLASAIRHRDFPAFDHIAQTTQSQLEQILQEDPGAADEVRPVLTQLTTIRAVASVAHDCQDGQLACYQQKLNDPNPSVVRKAAYMIAWTASESAAARAVLLAHADVSDMLVRRSIHTAIDALSPRGCAECVARLGAVIDGEQGQESRSIMHLEAQMLIARLRARATALR